MTSAWQKLKTLLYKDYLFVTGEKHLYLQENDTLLDIGGGGGYYARRLAKKVGMLILADRFSGEYSFHREIAKSAAESEKNIHVICGDAHYIPLQPSSVTKIFSNQILEHLLKPGDFFREAGRVLSQNGKLIVISQNAVFLASYHFPIRRILKRVLLRLPGQSSSKDRNKNASSISDANAFLSQGYEAWEKAVGHLHRFTKEDYLRMAKEADLEVETIYSVHGRLSFALWEIESAVSHSQRFAQPIRILCRAVFLPPFRVLDSYVNKEGVDLIGVFKKHRS